MAIDMPATEQPEFGEGRLYFVGNATTVIRYGGFSILTDPAFLHAGEHVHLGHGAYARREVEPACQISELPPLDLVVLSHHHGDHFDDVAARELDTNLPIITNDHAVGLLDEQGFTQGHALDTWESQDVTKGNARLRVTSMPGKHAPDHVAELLPPVMGSMLDFYDGDDHRFRLYISGDTLLHERREQAVRCVEIIGPRTAVPIHYNDFSVFRSGLDDIKQAVEASALDTEFHYVSHGDEYRFRSTR